MKKVLFLCPNNAGLSPMAAALFNQSAEPSRATATSAGPHPRRRVYPPVVEAMREVGIDLSAAKPRYPTYEIAEDVQLLVTMGCPDEGPFIPGLRRLEWSLDDPKDQPLEVVRRIRDEVARHVRQLVDDEGWSKDDMAPVG